MEQAVYRGAARQLVLAFDIGTTFSGISYCVLESGQKPKVCSVSRYAMEEAPSSPYLWQSFRYPGQEHVSASCKIPTILCYNAQGRMCAAGAEALLPESSEHVEEGEWTRVEWYQSIPIELNFSHAHYYIRFKLRMRPQSMPLELEKSSLPPIPAGKTLVEIFSDFVSYLQSCAEIYLLETYATLVDEWDSLRSSAVFILCHPNGWEGGQQAMMRKAAIMAKLVPDTPEGRSRVKFVTEGEASLHRCLHGRKIEIVSSFSLTLGCNTHGDPG